MKRILYITGLFVLAAFSFIACSKKDEAPVYPTLDAFIKSQSNLSLFSQALEKAQLQDFKTGPGPFTWFAPTNAAFQAAGISSDSINKMTVGQANYLLVYHLINAQVNTKDMIALNSFAKTTQLGSAVYLGQLKDSFYVNGNAIISPNNYVSNGVVHMINRLVLPPTLKGNIQAVLNASGQHNLFIAALNRANRWTTVGSTSVFTVLAPTDAAMAAAGYSTASINAAPVAQIDSLVRYHLFSGSRLFTNDLGNGQTPPTFLGTTKTLQSSANGNKVKGVKNTAPVDIITPNILVTNGVVHFLNGVLSY